MVLVGNNVRPIFVYSSNLLLIDGSRIYSLTISRGRKLRLLSQYIINHMFTTALGLWGFALIGTLLRAL